MAQGSEFPLRKPPGFHYDFFLLGVTTFLAGLLGLPAPNGLIPQAPIHTMSLTVMGRSYKQMKDDEDRTASQSRTQSNLDIQPTKLDDTKAPQVPLHFDREVPISVVEQRVSNLAQGSLCLVLLTGPFLHVLSLIPRGVLAGLLCVSQFFCNMTTALISFDSWYMGADALLSNGMTHKIQYCLRDKHLTPADEPLRKVRKSRILMFLAVQLVGFGATFAITQTIGRHINVCHNWPRS